MKKRMFYSLLFVLLAVFLAIPGSDRSVRDARSEYDAFLKREYRRSGVQTKNLPQNGNEASQPDLAAIRDYFMTLDPELKRVPVERLYEAVKYRQERVKDRRGLKSGESEGWTEAGSDMGGRCRAIMWDPNDPDRKKVWAAGVTGGLWYNNDITSDTVPWQPVNDFWDNLVISSIAADPCNPQVFYLGTGEPFTAVTIYRESSGVGLGIWKSSDAGATWELLPSTAGFTYISKLGVRDENGTGVVYAGVLSGVYHGINFQSEPSDGLYRSADGGMTWHQVLPDIPGEEVPYSPADIEFAPNNRIYIGTMPNIGGDGGAVILYSGSGLEGSWTVYDDYVEIIENDPDFYLPGRVELSYAPSDLNRLYAIIGAGYTNSQGFNFYRGKHILRSDSQGETWMSLPIPENDPMWALIVWHSVATAVDPNDPDRVYIGGKDVWRSTNGGYNWTRMSDWELMYSGGGDDYVHCDQHVQLYRGFSSDTMLFATDGGIFYTVQAAQPNPVFVEKNKNFSTLQFYTCDIYPVAGVNYFVGGLQDNATLLYQGEPLKVNDMIYLGDGAYCFFDTDEPEIMLASTYYNEYGLFLNFNHVDDFGDGSGVFINPAAYDSKNNILYANAAKFNGTNANTLLRVTNIPDDPALEQVSLNTGLYTYYTILLVSPFSPNGTTTLFLGSHNGRIFKVTDAHSSPQATEIGKPNLPFAYVSSLTLAGSEDTLLATFSNYGVPKVYQTTDGGATWEDKTGNIPDMPVRWAVYHPECSDIVMVATELGVWTTAHINQDPVVWEPDAALPNVRVDMLKVRKEDNLLLVATHGRGLFYKTWDYSPVQVREQEVNGPVVYPNPGRGVFDVVYNSGSPGGIVRITVSDLTGKPVLTDRFTAGSGENRYRFDIHSLPSGIYLVEMDDGKSKTTTKIVKK